MLEKNCQDDCGLGAIICAVPFRYGNHRFVIVILSRLFFSRKDKLLELFPPFLSVASPAVFSARRSIQGAERDAKKPPPHQSSQLPTDSNIRDMTGPFSHRQGARESETLDSTKNPA